MQTGCIIVFGIFEQKSDKVNKLFTNERKQMFAICEHLCYNIFNGNAAVLCGTFLHTLKTLLRKAVIQ